METTQIWAQKKQYSLRPVICPYSISRPVDWSAQFLRKAPIDVEIGFGMGEVLMRLAEEYPERDFIGIEQHWQRLQKTLRTISKKQAESPGAWDNIRILKADARDVFERLIAPKTLDSVLCLFPCPWPKKGHVKNRLFARDFLKLLNSRLKDNGHVKIVTDHAPYREWIVGQVERTGFVVDEKKTPARYETKFEKKWRAQGQEEFYELTLIKKSHVRVPIKKDAALKNYAVKEFDPDRLRLSDLTGETSVIFKGKIYDREQKRMMVHTIVAEGHLTQHFWILISKKKDRWNITKADGQNFYPTQGIATALQLVYEAARET